MADLKEKDIVAPDHRSVCIWAHGRPLLADCNNSSDEYDSTPHAEKGRQQSVNLNRNVTARYENTSNEFY